jgi:hypothetical protein
MAKDKENQKRLAKEWYERNKKLTKERARQWAIENPERRHEIHRKNRDKDLDNHNARNREWNSKNKSLKASLQAKRRAAQLQRTPKWLTAKDHAQIADFYAMAKELESIFPWKQHIDHIIPLQGRKVSGLHTPSNLQIIPAQENVKKSNKHSV